MGTRIGGASGREVADIEEDSDMARKVSERRLAQGIKILLLFPSQFCKKKKHFSFSLVSAGNNSRSHDIVRLNFENVRPISHHDCTC